MSLDPESQQQKHQWIEIRRCNTSETVPHVCTKVRAIRRISQQGIAVLLYMEPIRMLSDSELAAAEKELKRRGRQRRLEDSSVLRSLDANATAVNQLQTRLNDARAFRAKLIEQALEKGHSRAQVADAARITVRRLDAIRSNSVKPR